jgi:Mrp family chromosome partitioning ATPase
MSANGTLPSAGSAGGFTLWFTGLPCAGKTTLAAEVGLELRRRGCRVEVLDADALRTTFAKAWDSTGRTAMRTWPVSDGFAACSPGTAWSLSQRSFLLMPMPVSS